MAAPTFFGKGTLNPENSGTSITPVGFPASIAANDIAVLGVGCNASSTFTTPSGQGAWAVLGTSLESDAGQSTEWYWLRLTGSETAETVAASATFSNTVGGYGQIWVFRGCVTTGNPFESVGTAGTASETTPDSSAVTTTGIDRLVVCIAQLDNDTAFASGFPPGGWTDAGGASYSFSTVGGDWATYCMHRTEATATTVASAVVGTLGASTRWRTISFALIPDLSVTGTAAPTQADQTSTASGTVAAGPVTGTVAATQAAQTATATGVLGYTGWVGRSRLSVGNFGTNFSTPDHASFALGSQLALRLHFSMADWTPAASTHQFGQIANPDGNYSWTFSIHPSSRPRLAVYPAGTNASLLGPEATANPAVTDGKDHWLGVVVEGDIGGGNRRFTYEESSDGITWTTLGSPITESGTFTFFNSTAVMGSPGLLAADLQFMYSAKVWSDAARTTLIADPDFTVQGPSVRSFVDSAGRTWTIGPFSVIVADSVYQADQTSTASGQLGYTGTAAVTQANQTSTASGTVAGAGVSGSVAETQDDQTSTASGTVTAPSITGTATVTQANQTSTATGVLGYTGTSARTQANQTATATGVLGYSGTSARTQANQTATATGSVTGIGEISGSLSETQDPQTSTATGQLGYSGTSAHTQANQTATASGWITITGTVAETQDNQTGAATGKNGFNGTVARIQANQTATAAGWITVTGLVNATQANQVATGVGFVGEIPIPTGIPLLVAAGSNAVAVTESGHELVVPAGSHVVEATR